MRRRARGFAALARLTVLSRRPSVGAPFSYDMGRPRRDTPTRGAKDLLYWLGRLWLGLFGWKVGGVPASYKKCVLIAAPHTSNWDLPFMLATALVMGVRISWFGKHTVFKFPFGWFMRKLGGIPVDRRAPQSLVSQTAERFKNSDYLVLAVPPEGTRGKVALWKSGFYHIAAQSGVPIGLGYLDYGRKSSGLGMFLMPSGNITADMDTIRAFYRDIRGKYPEMESEPRLREEISTVI